MLFNEIYGVYYEIIAVIIDMAQKGLLNQTSLLEVIRNRGFEESILSIPAALKDRSWPVINPDYTTNIKKPPLQPVTTLELRWIKALLLDPRVQLFNPSIEGLDGVTPLFSPDYFVYYDRYEDGDPYTDEHYKSIFQTFLRAIKEKVIIQVHFRSTKGDILYWRGIPKALEYSSKDDKFRLRMKVVNKERTLNVGQVINCELTNEAAGDDLKIYFKTSKIVVEVTDDRNALERVLLHFSHFKRSAEKIDDHIYRIVIECQNEDLKELVIRILSFGSTVKVISPQGIRDLLIQRIQSQIDIMDNKGNS